MNIIYIILLNLALLAICVGLVFLTLRQMTTYKGWLIAADVAVGMLFCILLIHSAFIPNKINSMLTESCNYMEQQINIIQPDYTDKVLDNSTLKELIKNEKHISVYLNENDTANLFIRLVGVKSYLVALDAIVSNMDEHLCYFEKNNIPLTLHNIFEYTQEISQQYIIKVVKILQWLIVSLAMLLYLAWIILFCAIKYNWIEKPTVTYGEQIPL